MLTAIDNVIVINKNVSKTKPFCVLQVMLFH